MTDNAISKGRIATQSLRIVAAVAAAVALPQLFHLVGVLSGTGAALGTALLPMQLPVLLAGMLAGPVVGTAAGLASALISFLLTGMPSAALLPFMMAELGVYGLTSGLIRKSCLPGAVQLLIVQLSGRAARVLCTAVAVLLLSSPLGNAAIYSFILAGAPGILLQWAIIPLLLYRVEHHNG